MLLEYPIPDLLLNMFNDAKAFDTLIENMQFAANKWEIKYLTKVRCTLNCQKCRRTQSNEKYKLGFEYIYCSSNLS